MQRDKIVQRENSDHTFFLFRRYDEDNSGGLSSEEVRKLFADYQLGVKLSDEEADLVVKMLSKSGAKEISYADFKLFWSQDDRFKNLQWSEEEMDSLRAARDMYARLDKDGNGLISRSEFRLLHKQLLADGFEVPESLDECLKLVDKNESGTVDFSEFVQYMRSLDAFRKRTKLVETKIAQEEEEKKLPAEDYVKLVLDRTNYAVLKAFRKYDVDRSSSISATEFRKLVRDLGFHLSAEEAELQVKLISTRGNKEIEFGEFKAWWMNDARVENLKWDGEELGKFRFFRDLYDEFDVDSSGIIDEKEFEGLYKKMDSLGFVLPPMAECLKSISKSSRVNFNDFVAYLKKTGAFQFWRK